MGNCLKKENVCEIYSMDLLENGPWICSNLKCCCYEFGELPYFETKQEALDHCVCVCVLYQYVLALACTTLNTKGVANKEKHAINQWCVHHLSFINCDQL